MRKCADGLACFSTGGTVYCDWASNGVITECSETSSSKAKRQEDYGVEFVDGSGNASSASDESSTTVESSTDGVSSTEDTRSTAVAMSTSSDTSAATTSSALDSSETSRAMTVGAVGDSSIASTEATTASADSSPSDTAVSTITMEDDIYTTVNAYTTVADDTASTSTTSAPSSSDGLDSLEISAVPYIYNTSAISPISLQNITYTNVTSTDTASVSTSDTPVSDITSSGPTPPTNVTLAIQALNTTHFVAVLQASTLNNTPILTDWSFSFNSDYQILGADRGNLTGSGGSYTITSIPIQEPDRNMAVIVKLWGVYDANTAEGMVTYDGVSGMSAVNGTFSLLKRAIRMGFGL
jgi:hypothetical protein